MKSFLGIIIVVLLASTALLTSCGPKDTTGPKIYLLDVNGTILQSGETDTVVLLATRYIDPGIKVEDNGTVTSKIIVENDSLDAFDFTDDGYLKRVETIVLTYTAKDEEGNISTATRNIRVANIAEPFVNSYRTTRSTMHLDDDTAYNSTVAVDNRVAGRLRFPKVYAHTWDGKKTYFKVNADLFHPNLSDTYSETIGYLGSASDNEKPFFKYQTYTEGVDSILCFTMLKIDAQNYTDSLGNQVFIQGVEDETTHYPLSRIEYIGESKTIKRIVLELNVTKVGQSVDRVTEVYIAND